MLMIWNDFKLSLLLTVRVERPLKMDSRKRKHEDGDKDRLARLQLFAVEVKEEEKELDMKLSAKQKPIKTKRSKGLEMREKLRLELTRLEREEEEEQDKMALIELEKTEFPRKISEQEIKIRQVQWMLDALIKQKVEFEEQINEAKKEMNKTIIQSNIVDSRAITSQKKMAHVQEQLKAVRKDLHSAEGREKVSDLEVFMDRQILELESELKCPVCFEVARTVPIFKCSDDHLICR